MAEDRRTKRLWWLVGLLLTVLGWGGGRLMDHMQSTAEANTRAIAALTADKLDRDEFLRYEEKLDGYMSELRRNDAKILDKLMEHEENSRRRSRP